jgi:glycosyltransferase involved in cell wall biosynthesis
MTVDEPEPHAMRHTVVMVASSYPRFPGDGVGSFMEPIAKSVAARGHDVHLVAPWHPLIDRRPSEDGVVFHFYRYAPVPALNVFGYAAGMKADTNLRVSAWLAAPLALGAGWLTVRRVASRHRATVLHGHWVVPGGVMAAAAGGGRPLVISLHGSDVYVAERHGLVGAAARAAFRRAQWVTACSDDLSRRAVALGANPETIETVPYGVDPARFTPSADIRGRVRAELRVGDAPLVFSAGRLVSKKGFEYLIDATAFLATQFPGIRLVIAGDGDLRNALERRAHALGSAVILLGSRTQDDVGRLAAGADVVAVPSVHDSHGNVDGLPNFALEAMATGTPVVATRVGGLPDAIEDGVTGRLVPERDARALVDAIGSLLANPKRARSMGDLARAAVIRQFGWDRVAERFELAYERAVQRA